MVETLILFKTKGQKADGTKFDRYYGTNKDGISINVNLTDDAKADILRSGMNFPMEVDIDDDNYFIAHEISTDNNGNKVKYAKCVITSLPTIRKADLKKYTLSDYFKDKGIESKGL